MAVGTGTHDEPGLERQLLNGPLHGGAGELLVDAGQLEEHAAGVHHGDPQFGVALARAHARLGRLLGHGLVGEDPDPDLATTLHVPGHGDTGGLNLARREPAGFHGLDPEVAERYRRAALGLTPEPTPLRLAVLDLLGHQHVSPT